MEFEDVSEEQVEREARRVAAAFGMEEWTHYRSGLMWHGTGQAGLVIVTWQLNSRTQRLTTIAIAQKGARRTLAYFLPAFGMRSGANDELLARGLYRLGFEDEDVMAKLNYDLTAHEKLELSCLCRASSGRRSGWMRRR